ncbi:MAG: class I adenylate-forming enzyme family protein, partial [Pseudomonadota bacterium]
MSDGDAGYSGALPRVRFNMARYCLGVAAQAAPEKTGLIVLGGTAENPVTETWTFGELELATRRVGAALQAFCAEPDGRIFLLLGNTSAFPLAYFGAMAAGLVAVPVSSQLTAQERSALKVDARPALVVGGAVDPDCDIPHLTEEELVASARNGAPLSDYADTRADDPAFLVFTSGTTGGAKGVLHAHRSAWGRRPMYRDWYDISGADRVLHAGAFNWTFTLGTGLADPWANSATAIVNTRRRTPDMWPALIRATGATLFAAVPGLYRQILKYAPKGPLNVGQLRHGLSAGEALTERVAEEWSARTGTQLHSALGMSEISTYVSASPQRPACSGTVGQAQRGRAIAILPIDNATGDSATPLSTGEVGLLGVHRTDPGLMLGYWQRPRETAAAMRGGWFCGGDLASIDAQGFVTHHGRADDLMNAFGYRVAPQDVEEALGDVPGVTEIAVTEIEVREAVSIIAAFFVPADAGVDGRALESALSQKATMALADYKQPRAYIAVDALPRTTNGKMQRRALQAIYDHKVRN